MSPRGLQDTFHMSPRCLLDALDTSRCLPDVAQMPPRFLQKISQKSKKSPKNVSMLECTFSENFKELKNN